MDILEKLHEWTSNKLEERKIKRLGGIQKCPWCRQIANQGDNWGFKTYEKDNQFDVLTCGVCGGTSLWEFMVLMLYIGPLCPPEPAFKASGYYEDNKSKFACEQT
tara:strand:+ start:128 stop:442 length:315 start_codon:yes stop_codon:yes gene_type:complete